MSEFVLRPTVRHRPWVLIPVVAFAGICVYTGSAAGANGVLAGLGVAALVVVPIAGHLLRSRIVVTPSEISVRGFVTHKRADRHRAASILRATVVAPRAPMNDSIFILDRDEKLLLRVHGVNYPTADLDRLVDHLRLPTVTADRPMTAAQVAELRSGILPWMERHPYRFAFAIALGGLALLLVVSVIVAAVMA